MATKLVNMKTLSTHTLQSLSGNMENWTGFLHSAAKHYKYPFHDQLLIHAQRPDATACASYDLWNSHLKRYINRGAKGIALIDDSHNPPILRYVFDVSDTNSRRSTPFRLWEMRENDQNAVLEELANHFGEDSAYTELPFQFRLYSIVNNTIADNLTDYAAILYSERGDSSLADLDESGIVVVLTQALEYSVGYICMTRIGIDAQAFYKDLGVQYPISSFDTPRTISCLGQAASDISEMVLRQIERTVRENQRSEQKFAQSDLINENKEKDIERGAEYEQPHLHTDGRLSDTEPDIEPTAGSRDRQIWADAQKLLEGAETGDIQPHAADGGIVSAPIRSGKDGSRASEADHIADGESRGRDGEIESQQSDGMGAADEQYQKPRRGAGDSGLNFQLTLFPPEAEQISNIQQAEVQAASAFSIPQDDNAAENTAQSDTYEVDGVKLRTVVIDLRPQPEMVIEASEPITETLESVIVTPELAKLVNFRITDDALGHGGQKTKYGYNIAAISALKRIETERRHATTEEQEILSRYVGWGGIPQAFDESNDKWANEYSELKGLLTEKEYETARSTTLNAHYTSPIVISAMYETLSHMGFETGNILEPSMGIGNFFGLLPDSMEKSKLYGVEIDSITGRIAQQLYPNARIAVQGYEDTNLPDNFFDVAIGNVPFGSYGIADKRYDKNKFLIHDYFLAKSLDKVRPGGVIAFITSKGTLDKKNPEVRKYIAQRAELLGAVRLPNNAFLASAGTEVTTDIIFLQKRELPIEVEPDWVHLSKTADGIPINAWYVDNPDMVLGKMEYCKNMYGNERDTACIPTEGADLKEQLREALSYISGIIPAYGHEQELEDDAGDTIPADPDVRNFSYTLVEDKIYYRENSIMRPVETSITGANRIKGMIELRDCVRWLIDMQLEDYPDAAIAKVQQQLNALYDAYTGKYGILNSRGNEMAFSDDSGYFLLCSLEILDDEQHFKGKADMFTKRTIRPQIVITEVENASEALAASLSERGTVDMPYMIELTGLSENAIMEQLHGVLFQDLIDGGNFIYRTSDDFLSGNVRDKLRRYEHLLSIAPDEYEHIELLQTNVEALKEVQPKDLSASEIDVRLGATWLPASDIKQFMDELLSPDGFDMERTQVHYSAISGNWNIASKYSGRGNVKVNRTYGTSRINAYHIIENTLNLRDVRIYDTVMEDGKEKRVFNAKETMIAQQKQQTIKDAFQGWIWKDPQRRERLTRMYNDTFNCICQREYNGSHLTFPGMNPEIKLNAHQVNAVARGIYGGNELLAHCVGAGKTYTMAALAMKCRQIGLTHKSMIVVPNHIIGQFAGEFLQLYPSANLLVANKKDFEPARRKKFCARIATGNYDAIIIGHSQFEKIAVSKERQAAFFESQIHEIMLAIREAKAEKAENFTIKQMEGMRKSLEVKLKRLNDTSRKDDVIDFEALGADRLFVDEADNYKNLFLQTKMRNVAGIAQTEAKKSSDMYMKTQYINEITDYRGIVFATGTPISNSMVELYTMQRYLQPQTLRAHGLHHFDSWAATFGERVTALEIAPEGTGYRLKTRFAKFFNLPELMNMFRLVADIQTKDMLNLPTPKVNYHTVALKPSEIQREMVASLAERAEKVRQGAVDPRTDNMLAITNDGRKLALDQRLINPMLPDDEGSKTSACAQRVFEIWERTKAERLTQLIFCDISTMKKDGSYNVYSDMREKLIEKGVSPDEIEFIHNANTDERKLKLFAQVRAGTVRILLGSTAKMGAGTNVQRLLKAEHHMDCPWRPRDVEQREGRIERQGNENDEVDIFRYVKEGSFDSFLWQTVETKQKFISQVMTGRTPARSCEDVDENVLNYAEVKALATGDPDIKERMQLDIDIKRLKLLQSNYLSNKYELEDAVNKHYPARIEQLTRLNEAIRKDIALYAQHKSEDFPGMELNGMRYTEKAQAGAALLETCKAKTDIKSCAIGTYCGFTLLLSFEPFMKQHYLHLDGSNRYKAELGQDAHGNIQRLDNQLKAMPETVARNEEGIAELKRQMENAAIEIAKPFEHEFALKQKQERLIELDAKLNKGERFSETAALDEPEESIAREEIALER